PFEGQDRALERVADAQRDLERAEQRLSELRGKEEREREAHLLSIRRAENDLARARERQRDSDNPIDRESATIQVLELEQRLNDLRADTPRYLQDIANAQEEVAEALQRLNDAENEAVVNAETLIQNMYRRRQAMTEWADNPAELRELEGVP